MTERLKEFLPSVNLGEEFRLNICRVIVTAMTDRMRIVGFDSTVTGKIRWATEVFDDNRGPIVELDLYETLLRDGEAFVIIDVDQETRTIRWHVNQRFTSLDVGGDGYGCIAYYENNDPNQRLKAVSKEWAVFDEDGRLNRFRNIYYPNQIIKQQHDGDHWTTYEELPWIDASGAPLGIAAIHFYNVGFTREAENAFTLQDSINKTFLDLLTSSDLFAFRVFVALGWVPTTDGKPPEADGSNWMPIEPGRIIGTDKPRSEVSFDAIEAMDPTPILNTVQQCILWAAMATNTPASRFIATKLIASDETLKQQEEPLVAKIDKTKTLVSYSWRQVLQLTERVFNILNFDAPIQEGKLKPIWCHSASEESLIEKLQAKKALGIPQKQIWRELGYDEQKISAMEADQQADREAASALAIKREGGKDATNQESQA